ncbi:hypothetical protein B0J18DRAFT_409475 [Chaetomium sp. MPI-SDFR-AT-0129]|nr:hypothetical protein B0J18DRAFT_409475 [Chaetomium sp. MPI-SDFR-AT-0129]
MSAADVGPSQDAVIESSQKFEKKHKRSKSEHKKKRAREEDDGAIVEETPRKSKKSRSVEMDTQESQHSESQPPSDELIKKKKKKKERAHIEDDAGHDEVNDTEKPKKERKRSSKHAQETDEAEPELMDIDQREHALVEEEPKSEKKRKDKKSRKVAQEDPADQEDGVKEKKKRKNKQTDEAERLQNAPAAQIPIPHPSTNDDFPFFTQTISLYVPFFPVGFDKPLSNVAAQHLDPLLNHYSPLLRGVLLSYANLNLSDRPAKASTIHPPTDQTPALLHSIDEYAVGFGWLTFDAELFVPSRGKWMEGVVQLQSEGHIGVVCWNRFNASIEAKRLPQGWNWVDIAKSGAKLRASPASEGNGAELETQEEEEDMLDGEELQVVEQIHTTGYWVNEKGKKVSGKLRFRIKNFDVGQAGDYGYLSIEGTCLDDAAELAVAGQEREAERARRAKQNPSGLLRPLTRRVPEFSMTKFGKEDQEEDDGQRAILYKGSRPGTPDD